MAIILSFSLFLARMGASEFPLVHICLERRQTEASLLAAIQGYIYEESNSLRLAIVHVYVCTT